MTDPRVTAVVDGPIAEAPTLRPVVAWAAIVALIILAVIRSAIATRTDGFTIDDAYHITAGVSYVKLRDFRLNPEHPPLVKLWVGAALARDFHLPALPPLSDKFDERNFNESVVFLDNDPDRVRKGARVAMVALNGLLMLFLAFAISRTLGNVVTLGTITFLAIDPTVAAHLPVVLTDLPVALLAVTAILFAVQAFRSGQPLDIALAALALGLTLGTKHSGLIAFVAVAAWGVTAAFMPKITSTTNRVRTLIPTLVILLGALAVLWGLYTFRYAETASGEEAFNRPLALKIEDVRGSLARRTLQTLAIAHLLPRSYIWGLADTIRTGLEGRGIRVYFLGRTYRDRGPLYYFPTVLVAKLPLGLLALALAGLILFSLRWSLPLWRLPGFALLLLSILFLLALARGVSYGGVRHALPVLVVLSVFGGMASACALLKLSLLAKVMVAVALVIAFASAVLRVRPWEYFNELAGGPKSAYFNFGDEGVDMGQRTLDFVRYYRAHVEPAGEIPYLLYPMTSSELKRRGVHARGERGSEMEEEQSTDVSGIFFVRSIGVFRNPRYQAFREAAPVERIGNLLIYSGTFHLPWLRENQLLFRARRLLTAEKPDLDKAEEMFHEVLAINPRSFGTLLNLGNIMLRRAERAEALKFYEVARDQLTEEDRVMRELLTKQIERLSSNEPLERILPVRGTREE